MTETLHISSPTTMIWLLALVTGILASNVVTSLSLSAPPTVTLNELFSVTIEYNGTAKYYDVRLYVQSGTRENLSKIIVDGTEKSTARYILRAYPAQKTFTLKVVQTFPETELCVHMRESNKTKYEAFCQPLTIIVPDQETRAPSSTSESVSSPPEEGKQPTDQENKASSLSLDMQEITTLPDTNVPKDEPIRLNVAPSTTPHSSAVLWKVGAFTLFSCAILILLLLRKI